MILVILIFLILICLVKISNNQDIIKNHCKTRDDKANVKNAKKVFGHARYSIIMLIISIISVVIILICQFTTIDTVIINYFSVDIYEADFFNHNFYYVPVFLIICRQIIIEVKLSEFLHKFFNVVEEEISGKEVIKSYLYKKTPSKKNPETEVETLEETLPNKQEETKPEETKKAETLEEPKTEETLEEIKPEEKQDTL